MITPPSLMNAKRLPLVKEVLTWTAPAVLIPALRYFQDDRDQRKALFLRDASTYSLGAALFLGTVLIGKRLLARWHVFKSDPARELAAFLVALAVNILYAGIGAVRFSQAYARRRESARFFGAHSVFPQTAPLVRAPSFDGFERRQYLA